MFSVFVSNIIIITIVCVKVEPVQLKYFVSDTVIKRRVGGSKKKHKWEGS